MNSIPPRPNVPQLKIHLEHVKLGIDVKRGQETIRQPQADVSIKQPEAVQRIQQPQGELKIDQSRAWDALGKPVPNVLVERIAQQSWGIASKGIQKIVQEGQIMAAIHENRNVFAEIGKAAFPLRGDSDIKYTAKPSMLNVDISYTAHEPIIEHTPRKPEINIKANKPIVDIEPNRVHIYMEQWPKVEITPPQLDITI